MTRSAHSLLILAVALGAGVATAHPEPAAPAPTAVDTFLAGVRRSVLPNGLTVLTREQPGSGVVAVNTWVKAGYFNEPDEVAGMAHLFEHMFFKGSKAFPGAEQIAEAVSSAGGVSNAGTIYDSTNYYFVLPRESFARGVEIQADAIRNPLFDPEELRKEAEVVIEESNRKLDNPPAVAVERMYATAFTQHRMKRWRIGSNQVLRNIKRANLLAFFETLYRPDNIIVSVAGDVGHDEALTAVERAFGGLSRGRLDKRRGPQEPPQTELRFGQSSADLKQGYTVLGWHTVAQNHADEPTLDVLASILGGGRSSRLYRQAVGPDAASSVDVSHETFDDVGMFTIVSSFDEKNRPEVDRRLLHEVARMRAYGPTAYELAQAKNALEVQLVSSLEDALGQAVTLSKAESRGSYQDIARTLRRLATLTPEEVRAAAQRYLASNGLTLYHYQPKGAPAATLDVVRQQVLAASAKTLARPELLPNPTLTSQVGAAEAERPPQQFRLSNGATLVVRERTNAPLVSTGVYFKGGRSEESPANSGITQLMASAVRTGTASRTGEQLDRQFEFLGTQLETSVLDDYFGFKIDSVTRFYEPALDLLADVVLAPSFPAGGVNRERHLQGAAIKRSLDSGIERPVQLYRHALYGDHPYGLSSRGSAASVEALDRTAVAAWWKSHVIADGALVVVVGNIAAEDVRRAIELRFAKLATGGTTMVAVAAPPALTARVENVESRERKQTAIVVGFPTVPPSDPDWPALRLLQSVTSGLSGTFFAELRGKRSLAYTVFASNDGLARAGSFYAYLATEAAKEPEAREALIAEIRKLQGEGIRTEHVERARAYYAGSTRIARQTNAALLAELARDQFLGLGPGFTDRMLERTAKLTAEDLHAVAKKYLAGETYVFAAVRGAAAK